MNPNLFVNTSKLGARNGGWHEQLQNDKLYTANQRSFSRIWRGLKVPALSNNSEYKEATLQQFNGNTYYVNMTSGAHTNDGKSPETAYRSLNDVFNNLDIIYMCCVQYIPVHVYVTGDVTEPILQFYYDENGEEIEYTININDPRYNAFYSFTNLVAANVNYPDIGYAATVTGYCGNLIIHNATFKYTEQSMGHTSYNLDMKTLSFCIFSGGIVFESCTFELSFSDITDVVQETVFQEDNYKSNVSKVSGLEYPAQLAFYKHLKRLNPEFRLSDWIPICLMGPCYLINCTVNIDIGRAGDGVLGVYHGAYGDVHYPGNGGSFVCPKCLCSRDSAIGTTNYINTDVTINAKGPGSGADGYSQTSKNDDFTGGGALGSSGNVCDFLARLFIDSKLTINITGNARSGNGGSRKQSTTGAGAGNCYSSVDCWVIISVCNRSVLNINVDQSNISSGIGGSGESYNEYYYENGEPTNKISSAYTAVNLYYGGLYYPCSYNVHFNTIQDSEVNININHAFGSCSSIEYPEVKISGPRQYNTKYNIYINAAVDLKRESDWVGTPRITLPQVMIDDPPNARSDDEGWSNVDINVEIENIPELLENSVVPYVTNYDREGNITSRGYMEPSKQYSHPSYSLQDYRGYVYIPDIGTKPYPRLPEGVTEDYGVSFKITKIPVLNGKITSGGVGKPGLGLTVNAADAYKFTDAYGYSDTWNPGNYSNAWNWCGWQSAAGTPGENLEGETIPGSAVPAEPITYDPTQTNPRIKVEFV